MKRNVTIALLTLLSSIVLTAAAQTQFGYRGLSNGRGEFAAYPPTVADGQVYTVSAKLNGSTDLDVYNSNSSTSPVQQITAGAGDEGVVLDMYIIPPPSGGTVVVTATLVGSPGTVLTASALFASQKTPTITSLGTTPTSQVYGATVLTADVSGNPSGTPNSGVVTFIDNGVPLSLTATVSSGVAVLHAEGLLVGVHTITAVYGGDNSFASSTSSSIMLTVDPANLTVTGITAENKVYDSGTSANLHTAGATLHGDVSTDGIILHFAGAAGAFSDKNIGTGKTVTVAGITFSGTGLGNYTLTQPTTTADISPKVLTVSGITASDKVYDGSTQASLNTGSAALVGVVGTEDVTSNFAIAIGNFDSKNVGSKPVTISGLSLAGIDAGNYLLTQPSTSASISKATASVAPLAASKVYGTSNPVFTGNLSGFVGSDNVTATYSRTAGETVTSTPYTISATLSPAAVLDNYEINYGTAAFTITKATASVTPNAATKVFGTTDPTLTGTLSGFLPADNVTATYTRTTGETVAGSPYTISATLNPAAVLPNYNIAYNTANFTITKNISATALSSSAATSVYGESVTFTATITGAGAPTGTVTFKNGASSLGTGTLNGLGIATLSTSTLQVAGSPHSITAEYGGDNNFDGSTSSAVQQTVTPKTLTVTGVTAVDKTYDGTTDADLNTHSAELSGVVGDDHVNLHANGVARGSFADKNVGTSKPVTVSGIFINGPDGGNYTITQPTLTASISKTTASVVPLAASKVYGTSDPAFMGTLSGFIGSDNVTAAYSRTSGETVTGGPYTISPTLSPAAALDNYNITNGTAAFTITKATASVTPHAATKVFGTIDPALTGTLSGFLPADNVTALYTRASGETVAGSPYSISATLSPAAVLPNYDITYNSANFVITTNTTTTALSSSAATSVYGQSVTFTATVTGAGTPTGTVTFKDGALNLGTGTLNGSAVGTLSTSALQVAGSPHTITAVYGGDGNFAGSTSSAIQQTVTAKALTVGGVTAGNKVYDGNTNAVLNTGAAALTGVVSGDDVSLNAGSAAGNFNDKNVGTSKPVTVTGVAITGTAAGNYSLTQPTTTANITAKNLTVTGITANDKVYDGTTTATLNTSGAVLVAVMSGDNVTLNVSGASGTFADKEVGTAKTVTITGLTLSGTDAGNYTLTQPTTTASITAAPVNTGVIAGAGYVTSPAGALVKTPTATGRGFFAFAAAYIGNNPVTPTGLVEFQLKTKGLFYPAIMKFSSSQFGALVVSGSQATLKGNGSVDGSAGYGFLLSVIEGQGFTGNKLRIKIWDKNHGNAVVYDNQMGAGDNASPTGAVTGLISVSKSGGSTSVADVSVQQLIEEDAATEMPTQYELYNAYPNPFNPSTTIRFDLPEATKVRLAVYDMLGREVAVLADGERPAGQYSIRFDAGKLSSGMYIYRLQTGDYTQTKKLMLMK